MSGAKVVCGGVDEYPSTPQGPKIEPSLRWVRVKLGKTCVADSRHTLLLRQYGHGRLPTYYFPPQDVRMELLARTPAASRPGGAISWTVQVGDLSVEDAAWTEAEPAPEYAELKGYVSFAWNKGLTWLEEEEQVFVHARDPYKRVDAIQSSRHVQVVIDGTTVADTYRPTLVFETNWPPRYYIPQEDVRMDLLEPSNATTRCPYKGIASYWSFKAADGLKRNIVWSYLEPIAECPKIKGLLCFFNEHVDLYEDGNLLARPRTSFSRD